MRTATTPLDVPARLDRERQSPYPLRFWWLRRLSLGVVMLVLLLSVVRAGWGWEADRRLRHSQSIAAARGEVVTAAEMTPPAVADDDNAAWYVKQAAGAVDRNAASPASTSVNNWQDYPPFDAWWNATAAKSVAANQQAFRLARQARAHERFDWGTPVSFPAAMTLGPDLNKVRHLANTLGDAAAYAHVRGDDVAALETIRDLRHAARRVGTQPFLVCHLVFVGIDALAMERLQKVATGIRIAAEDGPPPAPLSAPIPSTQPLTGPRPVTRAHVRGLITELLDERDVVDSLSRAIAGERAAAVDAAEAMGKSAPLTRPMFRLDAVRMFEAGAALREAASQPTVASSTTTLRDALAEGRIPSAPPAGTG